MSNQKPKSKSLPALFLAFGVAALGLLAIYARQEPASKVPENLRRQDSKRSEVTTYVPKDREGSVVLEPRREPVPKGGHDMVFAVNQFLKSTGFVPPEARLLGAQVKQGTAYLDFNEAFRQTYGTEDEKTLLDGIRTTLGQFDEVQRVQFSISGEPMETLGNVDLGEPLDIIPQTATGAEPPSNP
jgi:hypothetical protein